MRFLINSLAYNRKSLMKNVTYIIVIVLNLIFWTSSAQNTDQNNLKMTNAVKELITMGEDTIVAMALKRIDENVSIENFTSASVLSNGEEVYVSFRNQYKYLPINSTYYFDVGVNITTETIYKSSVANPVGYANKTPILYFYETEGMHKHISFVKQAIGDLKGFEDDMIIRENDDYYDIEVLSASQESRYKVKKGTGKIYDEFHAHLEPIPYDFVGDRRFQLVDFSEFEN